MEKLVAIPRQWLKSKNESDYFAVNFDSTTMEKNNIPKGSHLLIRKTNEIQHGQIGFFKYKGIEYIRKYSEHFNSSVIFLRADYGIEEIIVEEKDRNEFTIIGVVEKLIFDIETAERYV